MHTNPAHAAPRSPVLVRSGVTASAVALVLAGFSGTAAALPTSDDAASHVSAQGPTPAGPAQGEADSPEEPGDAEAQDEGEEPLLYEVRPGDHLAAIAAAHGLDPVNGWRLVFDANPDLADPDLIVPGQVLRIPDADEDLAPRGLPAPPPPPAPEPAPQAEQSQGVDATAPAQQTTPAPAPDPAPSTTAGVWDRLAQCESGGNWSINTGNGYYGGLQFSLSSWQAVGGSGYPHEASRAEQIQRGEQLRAIQGWGAWPSCSSQLGLR